MPRGRRDDGGRRRQELIDVAAVLFERKGYDGTSIQDIADAMGVLKGSLYHYIASKEDLLFAVVEEAHHAALDHVAACRKIDADALTVLRRFAEGHLGLLFRDRAKIAVFLREHRCLAPERRHTVVGERQAYLEFLVELVRRGQAEGLVVPDVDPELAALGVIGILNWTHEWYRPGTHEPAAVTALFGEMAVRSIATTEVGGERLASPTKRLVD